MRYTVLIILVFPLIMVSLQITPAESTHTKPGSINYIKEGWILVNKSDIGGYLDVHYEKMKNKWCFTVKPNAELIKQARSVKPDFSKLSGIKYRENLRKINNYPITLQMLVCKKDGEEEWVDVTDYYLSKEKLNLLEGGDMFEVSGLDLKKHRYRLKIGFHSITYDSATNTITVTGGTETNPYTFEDLYNASVSNGWGVINKTADHSYVVDCFIRIGDGTTETWFADTCKQVNFRAENFVSGNGDFIFRTLRKTHVRFGRVVDESAKSTADGCQFIIQNDVPYWLRFLFCYGELRLYSTSIILTNRHDTMGACYGYDNSESSIWNCIFQNSYHFSFMKNTDVFNLVVINGSTFLRRPDPTTTINRCMGLECSRGIWFQGINGSARDVYGRNLGRAFRISELDESDGDCYIIDGDFDSWTSRWVNVVPERKVYRQYTVNLKVVDEDGNPVENATVKLYDNNDTLVVNETTDTDGTIPEQVVTYGFYQREGDGIFTHDEIFHSNSPHTLVISKEGYNVYEISFDLDKKIDWTIALKNKIIPPPGVWNPNPANHSHIPMNTSGIYTCVDIYSYTYPLNITFQTNLTGNWTTYYNTTINSNQTVCAFNPDFNNVTKYYWRVIITTPEGDTSNYTYNFITTFQAGTSMYNTTAVYIPTFLAAGMVFGMIIRRRWKLF